MRWVRGPDEPVEVAGDDLEWLGRALPVAARLWKEPAFRLAMEASSRAFFAHRFGLALLWLWGGLEAMYRPGNAELTFRLSASIAAYLEQPGEARFELQRRVSKLYGERSTVAHGAADTGIVPETLESTYWLLQQTLLKVLHLGECPTKDELERGLLAGEYIPREAEGAPETPLGYNRQK
jgi:hypothetical protein